MFCILEKLNPHSGSIQKKTNSILRKVHIIKMIWNLVRLILLF